MTKVKKKLLSKIRYTNVPDSHIAKNALYIKGGDNDVNLLKQDFENISNDLTTLRSHASDQIKSLTGELKKKMDKMINLNDTLYNDEEGYNTLYNLVQQKFGDITEIEPGTVAAYFVGCFLAVRSANLPNIPNSCLPSCKDSIIPKSEILNSKWFPCDQTSILATFINGKFNFITYNEVPGSPKALLFINYPSLQQFPGFTTAEKKQLTTMGIQEVKIIGTNGGKYTQLTDYVPVSSLKSRPDPPADPPAPTDQAYLLCSSNLSNGYIGVIVLSIIVLFLLIIIIFLALRPPGTSTK